LHKSFIFSTFAVKNNYQCCTPKFGLMDKFQADFFRYFLLLISLYYFCLICINGNKLCWGATCQGYYRSSTKIVCRKHDICNVEHRFFSHFFSLSRYGSKSFFLFITFDFAQRYIYKVYRSF
jgi:hypothetical protein